MVLHHQMKGSRVHVYEKSIVKESPDNSSVGRRKLFVLCFLGIFISYFIYGILQENITKREYGEEKRRFTFTMALVFIQCIVNALFAKTAMQLSEKSLDNSPHHLYAIMSFAYVGAMIASNDALKYVSYPTQVLGKSIKPIPVMLLGVFIARKSYPLRKYAFVLMIVIGVASFLYNPKHTSAHQSDGWLGEILLMISLLLDGVTGGVQDKLRSQYRTHTHRMMLYMNTWSILYLTFGLIVSGEGKEFVAFSIQFPSITVQLLIFSICSAIGQNFIFMTITSFGPLACSIITTTRKFFTILASVLLFHHNMDPLQWLGMFLVFIGLSLDSIYGKVDKVK